MTSILVILFSIPVICYAGCKLGGMVDDWFKI